MPPSIAATCACAFALALVASVDAGAPGSIFNHYTYDSPMIRHFRARKSSVADLVRTRRTHTANHVSTDCPPAPTAACTGKTAGTACSFTPRQGPQAGQTITGTCGATACCNTPGGAPPPGGDPGATGDTEATGLCARRLRERRQQSCAGAGAGTSGLRAASRLGDNGYTTVAVSAADRTSQDGKSAVFADNGLAVGCVGENIYGPFEAGFTERQESILGRLGCSPGSNGFLPGGYDTMTSEHMLRYQCRKDAVGSSPAMDDGIYDASGNMLIPRWTNDQYVSLLDQCGGHTRDYHFHERFSCLYDTTAPGHSSKVGEACDGTGLYGKWEDKSADLLPELDACGGHFGITPDSNNTVVYHYHVQDKPPFSFGCYGPNKALDGTESRVTVAQCRAKYTACSDTPVSTTLVDDLGVTKTVAYRLWCPCYDANGSNAVEPPAELPYSASTPTWGGCGAAGLPDCPTTAGTTPSPPTTTPPIVTTPEPTPNPTPVSAAVKASGLKGVVLFMPDDLQFYWQEAPARPAGETDHGAIRSKLTAMNKVRDEGVTFTNARVSAPMCAPSRWSMLAGRYASRGLYAKTRSTAGERVMVTVPNTKLTGADRTKTVQHALKQAGVETIMSGKWHLNTEARDAAWDYADTVAKAGLTGFTQVPSIYQSNMMDTMTTSPETGGLTFSHNPEWMCATSNQALETAVGNDKPFFLYHAATLPHSATPAAVAFALGMDRTPMGRVNLTEVDKHKGTFPSRAALAADASGLSANTRTQNQILGAIAVDRSLGSIMGKLADLSVLDDTLIIVTMDHGQNAKGEVYEGGTRVALMARWPKMFTGGSSFSIPVSNIDIAPTVLDAFGILGVTTLQFDGLSWFGHAKGDAEGALESRRCVVSEIDQKRAVICGKWKLISNIGDADGAPDYQPHSMLEQTMYNLETDPTEQTNLLGAPGTALASEAAAVATGLRAYLACFDTDTDSDATTTCDLQALGDLLAPTTTATTTTTLTTTTTTTSTTTTTTSTTCNVCIGPKRGFRWRRERIACDKHSGVGMFKVCKEAGCKFDTETKACSP